MTAYRWLRPPGWRIIPSIWVRGWWQLRRVSTRGPVEEK